MIDLAWKEERLLLTEDKDFGELVIRLGYQIKGVILLRLPSARSRPLLKRVVSLISGYAHRFADQFIVITESKIRIRRL